MTCLAQRAETVYFWAYILKYMNKMLIICVHAPEI